jgi:hypothetical protein
MLYGLQLRGGRFFLSHFKPDTTTELTHGPSGCNEKLTLILTEASGIFEYTSSLIYLYNMIKPTASVV